MTKPPFTKSDDYLRFFDQQTRQGQYLHLVESEGPILFPFRFAALAPGSEQSQPTTFSDLAPDKDSSHIYEAFLGHYPETFWYKIWHPYNIKRLSLDERVSQVSEDLVSILRYEDTPLGPADAQPMAERAALSGHTAAKRWQDNLQPQGGVFAHEVQGGVRPGRWPRDPFITWPLLPLPLG